jgi:hypothetical protein
MINTPDQGICAWLGLLGALLSGGVGGGAGGGMAMALANGGTMTAVSVVAMAAGAGAGVAAQGLLELLKQLGVVMFAATGGDDGSSGEEDPTTIWENLEKERGFKNPDSTKIYGHSKSVHGSRNLQSLTDRARSGTAQGIWDNDQNFIDAEIASRSESWRAWLSGGRSADIDMGRIIGRVIYPDGTTTATTWVRIVRHFGNNLAGNIVEGAVRTSYPIFTALNTQLLFYACVFPQLLR